jgi:classical protein kinase C/novel protein kinase C epsilon type
MALGHSSIPDLTYICVFFAECGLTCHAQCTHLVPDFCGMSMEAANEILETLIRAKNHNKSASVSSGLSGRTLRPGGPPQAPQDNAALAYPQKPVEGAYGAPQRQPSAEAISAATNTYIPPQSPTAAQRQHLPPRTSSSQSPAAAAAAAAAAATGLRTPQQVSGTLDQFPLHHSVLNMFPCLPYL